jgi:hypothetical protein
MRVKRKVPSLVIHTVEHSATRHCRELRTLASRHMQAATKRKWVALPERS